MDSDGTVDPNPRKTYWWIFIDPPKGLQHDKPILHLDLAQISIDVAIGQLRAFIAENKVEMLNVAGSRASKDVEIYRKTFEVVEGSVVA